MFTDEMRKEESWNLIWTDVSFSSILSLTIIIYEILFKFFLFVCFVIKIILKVTKPFEVRKLLERIWKKKVSVKT